ncbi:hypothetical protein NMG60_11002346 [Bertholletia excelsa]
MAATPERSRPLHNFVLPRLKWGNQRLLRCMKVNNANGDGHRSSASEADSDVSNRSRTAVEAVAKRRSSESFRRSSSSPLKPVSGDGNGIEAVREKLMFDLRVAADKMKFSILEEKELEESNSTERPWNLRTRRAACKAPNADFRGEERQQRNICNSSPILPESPIATAKSNRLRGLAAAAMTTQQSTEKGENFPRAKFSVSLSRKEIEGDFLAMAGIRPARRPKKRPRIVQRQVDAIFPGLWLTEITPDTYKVPDFPEPRKV